MVANPRTFGLGHMHSFFCVGALTSPLICQTLITKGWPWQRFYYISATLPILNCLLIAIAFHPSLSEISSDRDQATATSLEMLRIRRGETNVSVETDVEAMTREQASRHHLPRNSKSRDGKAGVVLIWLRVFTTALKTPAVLAFGFFVSMYTGRYEVSGPYTFGRHWAMHYLAKELRVVMCDYKLTIFRSTKHTHRLSHTYSAWK